MPLQSVATVEGEPIVIMTFSGHLSLADVQEGVRQTDSFGEDAFRLLIVDARGVEASLPEMLKILAFDPATDTTNDPPAAPSASAAAPPPMYFIGDNAMGRFFVNMARQPRFGGEHIPFFHTLEDALAAARVRLGAEEKQDLVHRI